MIINKPREGRKTPFWLKKFIADYAIGGGTPATTTRCRRAGSATLITP